MAKGKYHKWLAPEGLILLEGWARDGLTDEQISHNMGISCSTLYAWKEKYSEISEALKNGKEVVDIMVENALLKRALGYDYDETSTKIEEREGERVKTVKVTRKHVEGNVTAQIYWLKNRRPDKWRDKPVMSVADEYEDDGLLAALDSQVEDLFADGDDSDMIEQEEE